jgi:hypothetical protein
MAGENEGGEGALLAAQLQKRVQGENQLLVLLQNGACWQSLHYTTLAHINPNFHINSKTQI